MNKKKSQWIIYGEEELFSSPYSRITKKTFGKDDGFQGNWHCSYGAPSVQVIAKTEKQELILIQQYRFPTEDFIIEFPGGLVDKGESGAQAAARELLEETGYRLHTILQERSRLNAAPGLIEHKMTSVYGLASYAQPPELEPLEDISVILLPLDPSEIQNWLYKYDGIVSSAVYHFLLGQLGI